MHLKIYLIHWHKTGISTLLSTHPDIPAVVDYTDEDEATKTTCNKDTGTRKKLKKDYIVLLIQLDGNLASDVSTRCSGRPRE